MKKYALLSLFVIVAILLSSCSLHLGLSKLVGGSGNSGATATKHIKATHTPPSPSTQGGGSAPAPGMSTNMVTITSSGYKPHTLQVKVGTTVTWTNNDTAAHTVTSDTAGLFDSGSINAGGTFTFTFNQAGSFPYHSANESAINGTITVAP